MKIPTDCLDFSIPEERCLQCYSGYALDENFNCIESVEQASDPYCNEFQDGVCVKCSFGFYFNDDKVCARIPDECKTFSTETEECKECYPGYALN